jgi:hypothetical protein
MNCLKPYSLDNKSREYYLKGAEILIVKNSPKKNYCQKKKKRGFSFFPGSHQVPNMFLKFPLCSSTCSP